MAVGMVIVILYEIRLAISTQNGDATTFVKVSVNLISLRSRNEDVNSAYRNYRRLRDGFAHRDKNRHCTISAIIII